MAANTFLEMTRSLRLYVPQLPIPLAEQFIRDRYRRILERRDWSALRREGEFQLNAQKTAGTVAITRGSTTVTGTSTAFASTDVGRQFKAGSDAPVYTISAYTSSTSVSLDRAYGGATVTAATYRIFDGYVTAPTDFLRFISVSDPQQGCRLHHYITFDELNSMDPQRTTFGTPYLLADRIFNSASTPMPTYECWPYTTTAKTLYYLYMKRAADLVADDDIPIWPLRSDVIVQGALSDAARWPGTAKEPNPYFTRPDMWKSYEMAFEDMMIELERRDQEVYMDGLRYPHFDNYASMGANWMQNHVWR
jgi:hypothetical protein